MPDATDSTVTTPPTVTAGPFFVCDECGERYWDWHICQAQRARIAEWERQMPPIMPARNAGRVAPCTDSPLSDIINLICDEVSAVNAQLEALLADLRRERAQEAKQAKDEP